MVGFDEKVNMVKCRGLHKLKGHHKILIPRFDNTQKHARRWKYEVARPNVTTWQYYMSMESQHAINDHFLTTWKYI